jgi:hypothetical protein
MSGAPRRFTELSVAAFQSLPLIKFAYDLLHHAYFTVDGVRSHLRLSQVLVHPDMNNLYFIDRFFAQNRQKGFNASW